jgi:hypothetical protein
VTAVHVATVSDPQYQDNQYLVLDAVDHAPVTDAEPKQVVGAPQASRARRTWVSCEAADSPRYSRANGTVESAKLPLG